MQSVSAAINNLRFIIWSLPFSGAVQYCLCRQHMPLMLFLLYEKQLIKSAYKCTIAELSSLRNAYGEIHPLLRDLSSAESLLSFNEVCINVK